jgi:tetratricopeptide (TPR) repeat protein
MLTRSLICRVWGKVYFDLGDYNAALSAFKKVVSFFSWNDPFYGDSLLWLGGCYEAKNDYKAASDCYRKILAVVVSLGEIQRVSPRILGAATRSPRHISSINEGQRH